MLSFQTFSINNFQLLFAAGRTMISENPWPEHIPDSIIIFEVLLMKVALIVPGSSAAPNVARDLVYGCWCKGRRIAGITFPPLSLLSVGTVLKQAGHEVFLVDAPAEYLTPDRVLDRTKTADAAVVLTSSPSIDEDSGLLMMLKEKNPGLFTIVFGGFAAAEPEAVLSRPGIDVAVGGEAEYVVRDLLAAGSQEKNSWKNINGISFLEDEKLVRRSVYPLIENLDELPIPDRKMLPENVDYFNPVIKRMPYTTMFTSRGCPGRCTFCSSPYFYGRKYRMQSAGRVLKEIEFLSDSGYREIFFRDENFTASRGRVMDIADGIKERNIDMSWIASTRVDMLDRDLMENMKSAGCHMLRLGVESGVQELLDNVEKGISLEQTRKAFGWARELGIDTHAHLMAGLPGETKDTLRKTLDFILDDIKPTIMTMGILTPYPGTPLFDELKKKDPGLADGTGVTMKNLHTGGEHTKLLCELSPDELSSFIRRAYKSFYLRPGYIFSRILKLRNLDELKRLTIAGSQVVGFVQGKD